MLFVKYFNIDRYVKSKVNECKQCCLSKCKKKSVEEQAEKNAILVYELKSQENESSEIQTEQKSSDETQDDKPDKRKNVKATSSIDNVDERQVEINGEYAMVATKLELIILFSLISSFIVSIASLAFLSNYYCYYVMIYKFKWKIIKAKANIPI